MNKEYLVNAIMALLSFVVIVALWPILKWLVLIIVGLVVGIVAYTIISAKKISKDIENRNADFNSAIKHSKGDVIDVEYKEKVLEKE